MNVLIDWTQKEVLILAFDHRSSFTKKLFGIQNRQPTAEEKKNIEDYKKLIFMGFRRALEKTVPKEIAGLLVDEEYGTNVLKEAKKKSKLSFKIVIKDIKNKKEIKKAIKASENQLLELKKMLKELQK